MQSAGMDLKIFVGRKPMTQRVVLLFQSSWVVRMDVEDAVATKGAMVAGRHESVNDLLLSLREATADMLICEMACLAGLDHDQVVDLAGRFKALLVISSEHVFQLPTISTNIVVLHAPYREADLAAALVECGL